jgi:hypothetical protein
MRRAFILLLLAGCTAAPRTISLDNMERAARLTAEASKAKDAKDYARAAQLSAQAAAIEYPGARVAHYNAACWYALAGDPESAVAELRRAIGSGFANAARVRNDPDLVTLHSRAEWPDLVAAIDRNLAASSTKRASVADVRLVTDDIPRFWRAYDESRSATRPQRIAILRRDYIEQGSQGLIDYYLMKIGSVETLADFVNAHRGYYDAVRAATMRVDRELPAVRAAMQRMKALYPAATFADVYFVIGRLSSGGTASSHGLLIGTEMYAADPTAPHDELPLGIRRVLSTPDELPHAVMHELMHFMQAPQRDFTLLNTSVREGGAEFLAEIASPLPDARKPFYRAWGEAHADMVWTQFTSAMSGRDKRRWIGNNAEATDEWPADLGYFIGYEIARGYYDRAASKEDAIRDLLAIRDARAILAASGLP